MENTKPIWKNKNFLILWSGQTISTLGTSIDQIAFPLLILYLTGSPLQAGIGTLFFSVPTFLFGLIAGAMVDRVDRKKVMIACDIVRALATGSIPLFALFGHLTVVQVYIAAFIEGTGGVFFSVAETASLPQIVGKEQVADALAQNEASGSAVAIFGPAFGGFIYQVLGRTIPYVFDSVSYVASVISLFFVKTRFQLTDVSNKKELKKEVIEGLTWMWRHKTIRLLTILTAGGALVGSGQNLAIILLAKHFQANAAQIGTIFSLGAAGNLIGALAAPMIKNKMKVVKIVIYARWLMALSLPFYIFAPSVFILGIITAIYFFAGPVYGVLIASYRMSLIPDNMQGRVTSVYRMITVGGWSIGGLIGGLLLEKVGTTITEAVFTIFLVILALVATMSFRNKDF